MFVGKFARSLIEDHRRQTTFKKMEAVIIARKKNFKNYACNVGWEGGGGGGSQKCL